MQNQPSQREYWTGRAGDEWASHPERIDAQLAPIAAAALAAAAFRAGERVLDIGCGAGGTTLDIARRVGPSGSVTGVDLSPQMLKVARERARRAGLEIEFLEADAGAASFPERFDAAFSRFGVMFFEGPVAAFAHIRRAMRAEGRLTFVCWRSMAENPWASVPVAAIEPMLATPLAPPDPEAPGPYALCDAGKVERILRTAGWRNVALSAWDGPMSIGGSGTLEEVVDFVLRIGPCARAVAEQKLDVGEARRRLMDHLAPLHRRGNLEVPAACWVVTANA